MTRKSFAYIISILVLTLIIFYFWASSANIDSDKYSSFESNAKSGIAQSVDTFRLMTYNIGYLSGMTNNLAIDRKEELFNKNLNRTISLLTTLSVDVCCFQEIDFRSHRSYDHDQLKELAAGVGYEHSSKVINWDKKYVPFPYWPPSQHFASVLSGQAILSNYPIYENSRVELSRADNPFYYNAFYLDRLAQLTKLKIGERDLLLINVHLEAWDSLAREKQAIELITLFEQYKDDYPVIILGDFNSTPPGAKDPYMEESTIELIKNVEELEMAIHDSIYFKNESAYFTFNSVDPYIRIDYMFYDKRKLKLINSRVLKETGHISDHLPLVSDVVFLD